MLASGNRAVRTLSKLSRGAMHPARAASANLIRASASPSVMVPTTLFHIGAHVQMGYPPVRDGDELSQPLEPSDVRSFWDNMRQDASSSDQPSSNSKNTKLDIGALRQLLATIVNKHANKGAVAMGLNAQSCCDLYETLDATGRVDFLSLLSREFCTPSGAAQEAAKAYLASAEQSDDPAHSAMQARTLRDSLTPQYSELFDQINRLPGGFAFLVHMRGDMLARMRVAQQDTPLRAMSDLLQRKLETWIIGTLDLKRITWNSPACTIEKLGQYESVHAVRSWLDVKRRLGSGRRCFGFFHRSVPMEPLVFVWVALTNEIATSVQGILGEPESPRASEHAAQCAIFYSINSQPGLSGVDLGNFLIKRVVGVLRAELPNIKTFCTLSPLPRFRAWLDKWLTPEHLAHPPTDIGMSEQEQRDLINRVPGAETWTAALKHLIDSRGWTSDQDNLVAMEPVVRSLGAHYLANVKRGGTKMAMDPVANFHLRNGACLHQVNWRGDTSYNGLRQSLGLMCNYNYVLDRIEDNNEQYVANGTIAVSGSDPYIARSRQQQQPLTAKL
ncbi:hypothetical protein LPJ66_007649 [Kickxella alabastrina]|uniref:Uncharacterized protein n=1 Tax=Kickxella alabastrina TaxID=61397 RepID=A0ACC1I9P5_9FUNG|nr:hypothetical protein LPJ66_007649 [Kickxella alabastrina]